MSASPSSLETHLGYWLRRVSNAVSSAFAQALEAERISVAEWVVLRLLHGATRRAAADLATVTGMTRGAVSKILDKLEHKGLTLRTENPNDNRVHWLALTREGQRLVPRLAALADRNDAHFFDCLSAQERATLRRLLEKLTDHHHLRDTPTS